MKKKITSKNKRRGSAQIPAASKESSQILYNSSLSLTPGLCPVKSYTSNNLGYSKLIPLTLMEVPETNEDTIDSDCSSANGPSDRRYKNLTNEIQTYINVFNSDDESGF